MPALRPYQEVAVSELRGCYGNGRRSPLFVLPTGGGKTFTFAFIANSTVERGGRVLLLAHRQELVRQISDALDEFGLEHDLIVRGSKFLDADAAVASVQTLVRRLEKITWEPTLIVVDEAHHAVAGSWRKIIDRWPRARLLGVTATPQRLDGNGLGVNAGGVFDSMVIGPTIPELTELGFLTPVRVFAPPVQANLDGLKKIAGDYSKKAVADRMDKPTITGDAVGHYKEILKGARAVAFCATVDHAKHVAAAFQSAGVPAESLDGKLDDGERRARIKRLESGATRVLTSCDIVSEGFDLPAITGAILLRPTASESLYLQQVGRALRPYPGKEAAIVLDHVGSVRTHGLPDEVREWSLDGRKKRKRKANDAAPIRQCEKCWTVFKPAPFCPSCGEKCSKPRPTPEEVAGSLQEVTEAEKKEIARKRRLEEGQCQSLAELEALGRARGYSPGWARHRWQARMKRQARVSGGFR